MTTPLRILLSVLVAGIVAAAAASPALGAYGFIQEWGGPGTAEGKFTDLRDVATDSVGNVYTVEANRLQKFGPGRTFLKAAGGGADFTSVAVFGTGATGVVYVVDRDLGLLRFRASDLAPLGALPLGGVPATWGKPRAVSVSQLGNLVVAFPNDTGEPGKISGVGMWNDAGGFIRQIGAYSAVDGAPNSPESTSYKTPVDVDDDGVPGGRVWVMDAGKQALFSFARDTGVYLTRAQGSSPTWDPHALAVMPLDPVFSGSASTSVYFADHNAAQRMWVWDGTGTSYLGRFGERGTGAAKYGRIAGIDIDAVQRMFVADADQSKVLEYGNGGTPGPGDPKDPEPPPVVPVGSSSSGSSGSGGGDDPLKNSPTPLVCIGLWSAATCGWLPPPTPVQVCVSYWENCNGFGGSKPAKQGTIDLSGFPSSISVDVECGAGGSSTPRATAVAARAPSFLKPETECLIEQYLTGDLPEKALYRKRIELAWNMDARAFKAEVAASYAVVVSGLRAAVEPLLGDDVNPWGIKLFFFVSDYIDQAYDEMAVIGKPYTVPEVTVSAARACPAELPEKDARACAELVGALNATIKGSLTLLKRRKLDQFLDMPFDEYFTQLEAEFRKKYPRIWEQMHSDGDGKKGGAEPRSVSDAVAAAKAGRRVALGKRFVLARAETRLRVGQRGRMRLVFPKATRAYLRSLRRAGVRSFTANVTVKSGSTFANQSRTTVPLKISLVKVRTKKR